MPPAQAKGPIVRWLPGGAFADPADQWDPLIGRVGPVCLAVERIRGASVLVGREKKNVIKQGQKLRPNCATRQRIGRAIGIRWHATSRHDAGTTTPVYPSLLPRIETTSGGLTSLTILLSR